MRRHKTEVRVLYQQSGKVEEAVEGSALMALVRSSL